MQHASTRIGLCRLSLIAVALLFSVALGACGSAAESKGDATERWDVQGVLLAWDGVLWVVDGVPIFVPQALGVDDQRALGARVAASGRVDEDGRRITTAIVIHPGAEPESSLPTARTSGTISSIDGDIWMLGDTTVIVPEGTDVRAADPNADPAVLGVAGSFAEIDGFASDLGLIAKRVVLSAPSDETQASPTATVAQPVATEPQPIVPAEDAGDDHGNGDEDGDGAEQDDEDDKHDKKEHPDPGGHKKKKRSGVDVTSAARLTRLGAERSERG